MQRLLVLIIAFLITVACEKDISLPPILNKQVEKVINASLGGTLYTSDSINLIIPPYAFPIDGSVFIGRTGDEPLSVPNADLQVIGSPITLKIPTDTLFKPLQLSFPVEAHSLSPDNYFLFLYNGSTYFPVEYAFSGARITVSIDIINWESIENKRLAKNSENILNIILIKKQTPPEAETGLKEIAIEDGIMHYYKPNALPSSRILLLVHGWTGRPKVWTEFIKKIKQEKGLSYTDIWTFGYNSSLSIQSNAEILAQYLASYANGANIDLVAHSMGGLVSRSMIEQYEGAKLVSRLIAIGSPHKGSPLAVSRYLLGEIVKTTGDDEDYILYNHTSQGFKDLNTNSSFIKQMEKLENPPIPYYTIAAINEPGLWKKVSGFMLSGPDDGIVPVSSALGVRGAVSPDLNVQIPVALAHLKMTKNDPIFEQVMFFLRQHN